MNPLFMQEFHWFKSLHRDQKNVYRSELWRFFINKDNQIKYDKSEWPFMIEQLSLETQLPKQFIINQLNSKVLSLQRDELERSNILKTNDENRKY